MRVAFLGLGIMGQSMASNLVKAGHEVAVWNRSAGHTRRRRAHGGVSGGRGAGHGSHLDVRLGHEGGRERALWRRRSRGVAHAGHDYCGFEHHLSVGDVAFR